MTAPSPLEAILSDVGRAIEAKLYYLAVHLALSIPDICSSLEVDLDPNKPWKGVEERYREWFEANLATKFYVFTADDCWAMRGGVIHNGTLKKNRPDAKYDRIVITLPSKGVMHENLSDGNAGVDESTLQLDAVMFCQQVVDGARQWEAKKRDDPLVARNMENLVRFREAGIHPHFVGVPVIA